MSRNKQRKSGRSLRIESMEQRCLMAGDLAVAANFSTAAAVTVTSNAALVARPFPVGDRLPVLVTEADTDAAMGLPMLDSLPNAPRTLFLDFTGSFESDWWQTLNGHVDHYLNVSTPAYNTNGNPASFDATEQQAIRDIWSAVAEDFAPFNINVSTHYYGSMADGKAVRVAIGGNGDWLDRAEGANPSGTSEIGSYLSSAPNTVFVFSEDFQDNRLTRLGIGTSASHEAGHAFNLFHHAVWSADGKTLVNQRDPGTDVWTPIMGANLSADRTTWTRGVTDEGPNTFQDDFAILGGLLGFRTDEPAITALAPANNAAINSPLSGGGFITTTNDVDVFKFTTSGGSVRIAVTAKQVGSNLIPRAELWSATSQLSTGSFNTSTGTSIADPKQSIIDVNLPAGTFFVRVKGGGDYCDMGQYTIKVTTTVLSAARYGTTTPVIGPTANTAMLVNANQATSTNTTPTLAKTRTLATDGESVPTNRMATVNSVGKSPKQVAALNSRLSNIQLHANATDLAFAVAGA